MLPSELPRPVRLFLAARFFSGVAFRFFSAIGSFPQEFPEPLSWLVLSFSLVRRVPLSNTSCNYFRRLAVPRADISGVFLVLPEPPPPSLSFYLPLDKIRTCRFFRGVPQTSPLSHKSDLFSPFAVHSIPVHLLGLPLAVFPPFPVRLFFL